MTDEAELVERIVRAASRPAIPIPESARQAVHDAAAALQVRRSAIAGKLDRGEAAGAELIGVGPTAINSWMATQSATWRSCRSTRPFGMLDQLRTGLPLNRLRIESGNRIQTVYHYWGLEPAARTLVANEPVGDYRFGIAPLQMTWVDQRFVLLQGPEVGGDVSVMRVIDPACLAATRNYWEAVSRSTFPVPPPAAVADLTARQRQVVALLSEGHGDEAIGAALSVSVRTVRSDVAAVLNTLGVRSRFAAGARLQLIAALQAD